MRSAALVREWQPERHVVGIRVADTTRTGRSTTVTQLARCERFATAARRPAVPSARRPCVDERWTTRSTRTRRPSNDRRQDSGPVAARRRRIRDQVAAQLILQRWFDALPAEAQSDDRLRRDAIPPRTLNARCTALAEGPHRRARRRIRRSTAALRRHLFSGGSVDRRSIASQTSAFRAHIPWRHIDVSFYRDDYARIGTANGQVPSASDIADFDVHGATICSWSTTCSTPAAALRARDQRELFDYGRPARIELAVLVDRRTDAS